MPSKSDIQPIPAIGEVCLNTTISVKGTKLVGKGRYRTMETYLLRACRSWQTGSRKGLRGVLRGA